LILGLVLAVMMLLLYTEFGRLRQALLILGVLPLATLGGLIALFVTGETLNVASAVGFIALFGVAVQNGIIMVANLNRVRETGASLRDAVVSGASERFRPVLMTATVATIGMVPAALATGVGSDVQRSVATVVRRADPGDLADAVHRAEPVLFAGEYRGALAGDADVVRIADHGDMITAEGLGQR
jgi:cobalt-zinc-cadmium resistance protein CzcA